jgi:UPF0755 protein
MRTRAFLGPLAALLLLAAAALGAYFWANRAMLTPGPNEAAVRLTVRPGETARAVLADLEARGALRDARAVMLYLRTHRRPVTFKAGEYEIAPRATPREIVEQMEAGRVLLASLTIVEGWTFADMRRAIEGHGDIAQTLKGKSDAQVMAAIGHEGEHPEGRFFPDTYRFAAGTSDRELLALAYRQMSELLASAWAARAEKLPLATPYEALTLASVVEKETGRADERARIAGVFVSRLRIGMRLQTDPTVIYGLGSAYDGDIHERDLRTDTPYNTYTRSGLPPTPIALPGRASVLAALHPDESGALYFVANGEGDGSHHFSRTLEEHNAAVQRYLARLRAGGKL